MKVRLLINGKECWGQRGQTILQIARENGIEIPALCYYEGLLPNGACRLCLVEVKGEKKLVTSCSYPVEKEIEVITETPRINQIRKTIVELLLSDHPYDCMTCEKSGACLLEKYAYRYGIKTPRYTGEKRKVINKQGAPFIVRDYEKCILCGRCVKVCRELVGVEAIDFSGRGFQTRIVSGFDEDLKESECVFCGNCVQVCPVGALREIQAEGKGRTWDFTKVQTICPYCGVGCGIEVSVRDNHIVKITGWNESLVDKGYLCVKGKFAFDYVAHPERLKRPLLRKDRKDRFLQVSWEEALDYIREKFTEIKEKHGPDALAGLASAKCTNEDNYLFQKLFRQVIKTNNVDHCARLCHAATIHGLVQTLGSAAMTNSLKEIEDITDCIIVTGTNVFETQPVTSYLIRKAIQRGATLIVIDPRYTRMAEIAKINLQPRIGTDVLVFNALAKIIVEERLYNQEFVENRVEGFEEFRNWIKNFSLKQAEKIAGLSIESLREVARIYATSKASMILWSMGITQHITGTDNVMVLSNLALLTGQIGKPGAGLAPLRGQNNVQGACDMGVLAEFYPGYQKTEKKETLEKFRKLWDVEELPAKPGLTVVEIIQGCYEGKIKGLYIMGENPLVSDPDISHVQEALEKVNFLVVQDIFLTETASFADVVLPACTSFEKEGTFTNTERRVQKLTRCVEPSGEAKPDWEIIKNLAGKFGYQWNYQSVWDVTDEISAAAPIYAGITARRICLGEAIQWPCPEEKHSGTSTLHVEKFPRGKGLLKCIDYQQPFELPDQDYPFVLTTGRIISEYHTRTMTGKVAGLQEITGEPFCLINHKDAQRMKLKDKDRVEVSSRRGRLRLVVRKTDTLSEGVIFIPFHFLANILTHSELDPVARIPEFKICACQIRKVQ